ncbi:MAG: DUF751 domain-containing protein [Pseudanabaenaceae cyanobacterium]
MNDFANNLLRYPKFLALISLGVISALLRPIYPFFRRPVTAIAAVVVVVGTFLALVFTLRAMLGLDPVEF